MNNQKGIRPKILILALTYFPFVGGAEVAVKKIAKRLNDEYQFDLITTRLDNKLPKKEKIDNVTVYRMGFGFQTLDKYIFTFFGFLKALKLYKKNRYNIIWPIMAAYSSFAVLFKIFTKCKVLLTIQEGDATSYIESLKRFRFFKPIYKLYFKKVDRVQVISNFLAKWVERLGVRNNKIIVVPNGVDLSSNNQQPTINNKKEKAILTVSRLVKKNGVEDLIKALKILITNYPSSAKAAAGRQLQVTLQNFAAGQASYKLLIVGDGPLKNKLQNLVKKLKLEDKVIFAGSIKYDEIANYYRQADIFCRPSLSEGFGNVFIEAMAQGVPVVATQVGGIVDFLRDRETGWFCQVRDPQSIAEKIRYILDEKNKDEVKRVVENAYQMVEEKYTWDKIAEQMRNIFQELLF